MQVSAPRNYRPFKSDASRLRDCCVLIDGRKNVTVRHAAARRGGGDRRKTADLSWRTDIQALIYSTEYRYMALFWSDNYFCNSFKIQLKLLLAVPSLSSNFCPCCPERPQPLCSRHGRNSKPALPWVSSGCGWLTASPVSASEWLSPLRAIAAKVTREWRNSQKQQLLFQRAEA